jgi:peptide methionine sulfoxide reductase MsrA
MQKQLKSLDPAKIGFGDLWRSFATHDPTTINRQGMMWERNTAVRYFITTREQKKDSRGLHWFNDR